MSKSTIDRRLSVAEEKARAVLRCDWCRYMLRDVTELRVVPAGANPADYYTFRCSWCAASTVFHVGDMEPRQRECLLLWWGKDNGERYRDVRVYAAHTWFNISRLAASWLGAYRRRGEAAESPATPPPKRHASSPPSNAWEQKERKLAEAERDEHDALLARGQRFLRRMRIEEKRKHGPHRFALAGEVKAILGEPFESHKLPGGYFRPENGDVRVEAAARRALQFFRAAELCELALWGETQPETREGLVELSPVVEAYDAARAAKVREEEERKRREEEERQRREEERRARLAQYEPRRVNGGGADWLREYAPPETEVQPTQARFRNTPDPAAGTSPLTPAELRWRLVERCAREPDLEGYSLTLFAVAKAQGDLDKMLSLANVSAEEAKGRGFSWDDADGKVTPVCVPSVR